jgi:hypothetical protein
MTIPIVMIGIIIRINFVTKYNTMQETLRVDRI